MTVTSEQPKRRASLGLLAAAFAAYSGAQLFNNTALEQPAPAHALSALATASGGWIEPLLLRSLVVLAAFLFVVVALGRRRMADVGWSARNVLPGLATFVGAWLALQLVLALWVLARGQAFELHPNWERVGVVGVLAGVVTQAFGHALVSDTTFRGFFLPELRARFLRPGSLLAMTAGLFLVVAGSALLFGLAHLPTRAFIKGSGLTELVSEQWEFFSAGLALGIAFVTTRNLFVVVGLHVLLNAPAPLVKVPGTVLKLAILCVFALVVVRSAWRSLRSWLRRRRVERDMHGADDGDGATDDELRAA